MINLEFRHVHYDCVCSSNASAHVLGINKLSFQVLTSVSTDPQLSISPPDHNTAATPRNPTTPAIPAAIIPVGFAAPPCETLELCVVPPAAVTEVDPVEDVDTLLPLPVVLPVLLNPGPVAVAAALAFLVALSNSAAAVAMPAKPVYVCK